MEQPQVRSDGISIRRLSVKRPWERVEESFSEYYNSQWFVPILLRRGIHPNLCNSVVVIETIFVVPEGDGPCKLEFNYPKNVLSHTLGMCKNKMVAIQFDFSSTGLPDRISKLDKQWYDEMKPKNMSHANMLLVYYTNNGTTLNIEHFEPHGASYVPKVCKTSTLVNLCEELTLLHQQMLDAIPQIFKEVDPMVKVVQYYPPSQLCPLKGPQAITDSIASQLGLDGFCKTWSWAWVDLRLQNKDVDPKKLMDKVLGTDSKVLTKFILDYAFYARSIYKQYIESEQEHPEKYALMGVNMIFELDKLIPNIENKAGAYSIQVIHSAINAIQNAHNIGGMWALALLLPPLLSSPDDWSKVTECIDSVNLMKLTNVELKGLLKSQDGIFSTSTFLHSVDVGNDHV